MDNRLPPGLGGEMREEIYEEAQRFLNETVLSCPKQPSVQIRGIKLYLTIQGVECMVYQRRLDGQEET